MLLVASLAGAAVLALDGCGPTGPWGRLSTIFRTLTVISYGVVVTLTLLALAVIAAGAVSLALNLMRPSRFSVVVGAIAGGANVAIGIPMLALSLLVLSDQSGTLAEVLGRTHVAPLALALAASGVLALALGLVGMLASHRERARRLLPG